MLNIDSIQNGIVIDHIQAGMAMSIYHHLWTFLDLKGRRVTMAGHDLISGNLFFRHTKCNHCGLVSCHIISFSCFQRPVILFCQLLISFFFQSFTYRCCRMKGIRAFFDKCNQLFCCFLHILILIFISISDPAEFRQVPEQTHYSPVPGLLFSAYLNSAAHPSC